MIRRRWLALDLYRGRTTYTFTRSFWTERGARAYVDGINGDPRAHREQVKLIDRNEREEQRMTHPDPDQPQDWIFTFGPDNLHPVTGESLGRRFVKIHGTCDETRLRMLKVFGRAWSSQYAYEPGMAKIEKWGWTEIPMP